MTFKYINTFKTPDFHVAGLIYLSGVVGVIWSFLLDNSNHSTYGLTAMIGSIFITCLCSKEYWGAFDNVMKLIYLILVAFGIIYCLESFLFQVGTFTSIRNGLLLFFPWLSVVIWTIDSIFISREIQRGKKLRAKLQKTIEERKQSSSELRAWMDQLEKDHPSPTIKA